MRLLIDSNMGAGAGYLDVARPDCRARKPLSYGRLKASDKEVVEYNCPWMILRMHGRWLRSSALVCGAAVLLALPQAGGAQNLGTLGASAAGESTATRAAGVPAGPVPRLSNGHVDFSGVWDHAYVPDMSFSNEGTPAVQKGAGDLPYSPAGLANITRYDPQRAGDSNGMCMPFGLMRSVNAPYPFQIMQSEKYVAFLFEQNSWFHVVPFQAAHSKEPNPTWFGER